MVSTLGFRVYLPCSCALLVVDVTAGPNPDADALELALEQAKRIALDNPDAAIVRLVHRQGGGVLVREERVH